MAIDREGITLGNEYVAQLRKQADEFASLSSDIISFLNGNGNFQIFREGTEKGDSIYKNINTCVDTIVQQLVPQMQKIGNTTSGLLDNQQNYNKADDMINREMVQ